LSPLRTSNHTPKRRVRSASSTPLRQRPSSGTSTPVRGRTALPQRTRASYLSRSPTKGREHTPSKPITTPVPQFRSRTKSPSKDVSRRAPSPAKTRARARSASPFRHVEKATPIVRAIDRPKYAQHSDRKIVAAEKQRQSASRQQDAFGGDAAKREWARWQRDHPVLRNVPMPQWRPSEEDLQRKDWSRMQHVMRHRIIDLEGSVLRWSNKARKHERERNEARAAQERAETGLSTATAALSHERAAAVKRVRKLEKQQVGRPTCSAAASRAAPAALPAARRLPCAGAPRWPRCPRCRSAPGAPDRAHLRAPARLALFAGCTSG